MAVTTHTRLNAQALRADFPIFEQQIHGKPLAFLDSAASSQKPRQMLDAMREFYKTSYANVHRGVYELAERATAALELAREKTAALLNAPSVREVIFVGNATVGILLSAYVFNTNGQDSIGNQIYHNVIYGGTIGDTFYGGTPIWIFEKDGRVVQNNLVAYNIFFRNAGSVQGGDALEREECQESRGDSQHDRRRSRLQCEDLG